eukprot:2017270-Pleurochrysis_carterae.AAC.1
MEMAICVPKPSPPTRMCARRKRVRVRVRTGVGQHAISPRHHAVVDTDACGEDEQLAPPERGPAITVKVTLGDLAVPIQIGGHAKGKGREGQANWAKWRGRGGWAGTYLAPGDIELWASEHV